MFNYRNLLIQSDKTIFDAIKIIDSTDYRSCFVVNKSYKLLGSITDGDIRRGLIKKISFDKNVLKVCNKKTVFIKKKHIKSFNNEICLPIVNNKKKIVGIKILKKKNKKVITALIMAGGKGLRLLPLTKNIPKSLIKIKGKALLESLIQKLRKEGFVNIKISLHHMSGKIKKFFKENKKLEIKSNDFINEKKPLGTAGSINLLNTNDKSFLLVNCDIKLNVDFSKILDFHLFHNADITVISKRIVNKLNFGVINLDSKFNLKSIEEKPVLTRYLNTGAYVLKKSVKKLIKKNRAIDMDELIKLALKKKLKVISYPLYEHWSDLGTIKNLSRYRRKNVIY